MSDISLLDNYKDEVIELANSLMSNEDIAAQLYYNHEFVTSESSLRRAYARWGYTKPVQEKSGFKKNGDEAEIVGKPYTSADPKIRKHTRVAEMLKERGEDPEEWVVDSYTVNEWTGPSQEGPVDYKQTKAHLKRRKPVELCLPGYIPLDYKPKSRKFKHDHGISQRVVFVGDQQAPYHDKDLHERFCELLDFVNPHTGVLMGDTGDFPDISRHKPNPEKDVPVQDVADSVAQLLYDYVLASEGTDWIKLAGNHDQRLRDYQVQKAEKLYGVTRGKLPHEERENPLLTVENLFRLDDLGIDYVNPDGDYEHAQYNLCSNLAALHGWLAKKGSGSSALATMQHLGFSTVIGHTHRQSLVFETKYKINGDPVTLASCETGTMAEIRGGLGYARSADWQQGCAFADIYDDDTFKLDLATYVAGKLYFRDKRF